MVVQILAKENAAHLLPLWQEVDYNRTFLCLILRQEKEGMLDEARRSFRDALELDNTQPSAKENLEKVQSQIAAREQVGDVDGRRASMRQSAKGNRRGD